MQVTINYFAQIRQAAGVESDRLSLDEGMDIQAVLWKLAERHGDDFRALILDQTGAARPSLLTLVNGESVAHREQRSLADGDELSLISAVAGG